MKIKRFGQVTLILVIFLLAGVVVSCNVNKITNEQEELIDELDQLMIPLYSPPYRLLDSEVSFLDQLKDAKIVGMGEATHGTKEFFQMKHRIFRYLAEYHGHKAFGLEADFSEGVYLNRCVAGDQENLEEELRGKMRFWTTRTKSCLLMLEWMKNYNQGRAQEDRVHYFGIDCQIVRYQRPLLEEYLMRTNPQLWEEISPLIIHLHNLTYEEWQAMEDSVYQDFKAQLEAIEERFAAEREMLIAQSSEREYLLHERILVTIRQALIIMCEAQPGWFRDKFMAENALWIADYFGANTRISIWAHNDHITKTGVMIGGYNTGAHLEEALGPAYQTIGFTFCVGKFTAYGFKNGATTPREAQEIDTEPPSDSVNFLLYHASLPNFAVHLSGVPSGSKWEQWLQKTHPILLIGAVYLMDPPVHYSHFISMGQYDWLIHFNDTEASEVLAPPGT